MTWTGHDDGATAAQPDGLDDAAVEAILAGRPTPAGPELGMFVGRLRVAAEHTTPRPGPELAALLGRGLAGGNGHRPAQTPASVDDLVPAPPPLAPPPPASRRRSSWRARLARIAGFGLAAKVGIVGAAIAAATTGAGAAGVLPPPVQDTVAGIVGSVTPFELPTSDPATDTVEVAPADQTDSDHAPAGTPDAGGGGGSTPAADTGEVVDQRPSDDPGDPAGAPAGNDGPTTVDGQPDAPPGAGEPAPAPQPPVAPGPAPGRAPAASPAGDDAPAGQGPSAGGADGQAPSGTPAGPGAGDDPPTGDVPIGGIPVGSAAAWSTQPESAPGPGAGSTGGADDSLASSGAAQTSSGGSPPSRSDSPPFALSEADPAGQDTGRG